MLPTYRLVIKAGPNVGKAFPLEKNELFIGRDLSNDVVINDPEISRRHARLVLQGGSFMLEDLGSTNGSFIRGQRLSGPYLLAPGDMITFGERINLLFEAVTAAHAAQTIPDAHRDFTEQGQPATPPPPAYPPQPAAPGGYAATQIEPPLGARPAPPVMPPPQQPVYQPAPPPQPVYQPAPQPQPVYPPQPAFPPAPPQTFEPYQPPQQMQPPPYAGQVPMPPPEVKRVIPAWVWVVVGILLLVIVVLVIDDFRLWSIFGIK